MKPKEKKKSSSLRSDAKRAAETRQLRWVLLGFILLVTAIAYSNSLTNGFVNWDDDLYVYANPDIRHLDGATIKEFFAGYYAKMYAPLTMISYALDYKIGGLNPTVYHGTNLLLHLLSTALVFYFLYLLTGQTAIAVLAAAFFGIHPLHVESVAWISERKDLLYTFFYLCGLIAYTRACGQPDRRRYYWLTLLFFLCSLLSKSAAVTFPLVLFLIDFYKGRSLAVKNQLDKIPFFILALAFGVLSLISQKMVGVDADYVQGYTMLDRLFLGAYSFAFYLVKSVWPTSLSALHPMPTKAGGFLPVLYYGSMAVVAGFFLLLVGIARSRIHANLKKDILFGLLFFLVTIVLILFIPVGSAVVAERYAYLPYMGIFMIPGSLYVFFRQKSLSAFSLLRYGYAMGMLAAIILFAGMTYGRNRVWQDTVSLFSDVIAKHPNAALAYNNRGNIRIEQKDFTGAMEDLNQAIELKHNDAYNNRGILRNRLGDYKNAVEDFNRAVAHTKFDKAKVYYNRGIARLNLGDFKGAEADFGSALQHNPQYASAYSNRGLVRYANLLDFKGAIEDLNQAIRLDPAEPSAYYNRANAQLRSGRPSEAIADYDRALRIDAQFAAAYFNKGIALLKLNNREGACSNWKKASDWGATAAAGPLAAYCR